MSARQGMYDIFKKPKWDPWALDHVINSLNTPPLWADSERHQIMKCPWTPKSCTMPSFLQPRLPEKPEDIFPLHSVSVDHPIHSLSPSEVLTATSLGKAKCPWWRPHLTNGLRQSHFTFRWFFCLSGVHATVANKKWLHGMQNNQICWNEMLPELSAFQDTRWLKASCTQTPGEWEVHPAPLYLFLSSPRHLIPLPKSRGHELIQREVEPGVGREPGLHRFRVVSFLWVPSTPPRRSANRGPIHVLACPSTAMSTQPWRLHLQGHFTFSTCHIKGEGEPLAAALGRNRAQLSWGT